MRKNTKGKWISIVGGNNADIVNPLGLIKQYKAVCVTEHKVLSPAWRNTKAEAQQDAASHIQKGHYIDYDTRITTG